MMTGTSVNRLQSAAFFGTEEPEVIETRFGRIALSRQHLIVFASGLLGMPDRHHYVLTEFPSAKLRKFKLLQSLDDHELSFITLPVALQNGVITAEDLAGAAKELRMDVQNLAVLLVVSVHRAQGKVTLSVNARAPLIIDSGTRLGAQYVFSSDKYQVQHVISA